MKAKILIALTVALLFSLSAVFIYSHRGVTAGSDVRICPNSGLPCDGDGLCSSGSGEPCGGGGCSDGGCGSGGGCCSDKVEKSESDCDSCPNKAAGTCPGDAAEETEI